MNHVNLGAQTVQNWENTELNQKTCELKATRSGC